MVELCNGVKRARIVALCYILELTCQMCLVGYSRMVFSSVDTDGHRLVKDPLHTVPGSAAGSAESMLRMKRVLFSFPSLNLWLISIVFPVSL